MRDEWLKKCLHCNHEDMVYRDSNNDRNPYKHCPVRSVKTNRAWLSGRCPDCKTKYNNDIQRKNLTSTYKSLRKTLKPKKDY